MRWLAVVNPKAGRSRGHRLMPSLQSALTDLGVETVITTSLADGVTQARRALEAGAGIIACGGDGTVAALAAEVAKVNGVMAIVPTGVGNDFARHLGFNAKNPLVSLDLIKPHGSGVERQVDLGKIHFPNGKDCVFTTVAHTGVDGAANEWANGVRFISGTLLYVLAVLRTLFTYRPKTITVRVGEVTWTGAAWLVAVGNTRNYAGGMIITPGAEVDDGWLEVCLIKKSSLTRLATCFPSVFRGTHIRYPEVEIFRGEKVEIESEGDIWANGELAGPLPATVTTMKRVLRIIGPVT